MDIQYAVASNDQIVEAEQLVRKEYYRKGYIESVESDRHSNISSFLYRPCSITFVALWKGCLAGTVSVVQDSQAGLPMDNTFSNELNTLRNHEGGGILGEAVQFATDQDLFERHPEIQGRHRRILLLNLFHLVLQHSLRDGVTHLCLSCTPQHGRMYRMLGFRTIGDPRYYMTVDTMAVAMALRLDQDYLARSKNPMVGHILRSGLYEKVVR